MHPTSLLEIVDITRWLSEAALVKSGCAGQNRPQTVRNSVVPRASETGSDRHQFPVVALGQSHVN